MKLVRWTPFFEPFEEMERAMRAWQKTSSQGFVPAVDVYETKTQVVVTSPLAGVDPKDVDISIENDLLTIRGEARRESEVDEKSYYRKEVHSGSFFRSVALPAHVVADKAKAESREGMLTITIPKAPEAKAKTVKVEVAKGKPKA